MLGSNQQIFITFPATALGAGKTVRCDKLSLPGTGQQMPQGFPK